MTRRQRRLVLIGGSLAVLVFAVVLMLNAFSGSMTFFKSPTEVVQSRLAPGTRIRLGGLVKTGSLVRSDGQHLRFAITDGTTEIPVTYNGVLPDLFGEGQGVVAEGVLDGSGVFAADTILAKHDEKYMPREVVEALKKSGRWQEGLQPAAARAGGGDK